MPYVEFQLMDFEDMCFAESTFDGIWAAYSLFHIPKQSFSKVLKKMNTILKGNGYLYLTVKKGINEGLEKDARYSGNIYKYFSYYQEDELSEFIENANFKILEITSVERKHSYQTHDALRVFCQKTNKIKN